MAFLWLVKGGDPITTYPQAGAELREVAIPNGFFFLRLIRVFDRRPY